MNESRNNLDTTTSSTMEDLPLYPVNADIDATLKEVSNITVNGQSQVMLTYSGNENFTVIESTIKRYLTAPFDFWCNHLTEILLFYVCIVIGNFVGCNFYRWVMGDNPQ